MGLIRNRAGVNRRLDQLEEQQMLTQEQLNATATKLDEVATDVENAKTAWDAAWAKVQEEIANGTAAKDLDFSGVEAATTKLQAAATALTGAAAPAPAPKTEDEARKTV